MSDLQKMKDDKLDLFIEHIKKELEHLEFKLQISSSSKEFSFDAGIWNKYYYYLTVLLQVAKEEKKNRAKKVKNESK